MAEYVIIGNGVAAAGCIEGIRSTDKEGKITVISREDRPVYCRPLISYYLEGKTDLSRINYRDSDFYEKNGCEVLYGLSAEKLDTKNKKITLSDGSVLPYSSVCVATGSAPFVPPFEGLDTVKNAFTFMTVDDTLKLEKAIDSTSRVLIVGAGLIGLKCAEGLRDRVAQITVCDLADRVLSSILDSECAAIMQSHLEKNGIQFCLGDTAIRFNENTAEMKSGKTVDFDVLVLAVGVRANTSLIKEAGGETARGILIDSKMQTSLPEVYAAGDCTEGMDFSCGERRVLAIMPNAYMQGHCAGVNMAKGTEEFTNPIPMNSIGFFGLHAMTAGSYYDEKSGGELRESKGDGQLKRLFIKDGLLTGFIMIGETERAGIYTSMIREKTPLASVNFEILEKVATSFAFSPDIRRKKFGGVV